MSLCGLKALRTLAGFCPLGTLTSSALGLTIAVWSRRMVTLFYSMVSTLIRTSGALELDLIDLVERTVVEDGTIGSDASRGRSTEIGVKLTSLGVVEAHSHDTLGLPNYLLSSTWKSSRGREETQWVFRNASGSDEQFNRLDWTVWWSVSGRHSMSSWRTWWNTGAKGGGGARLARAGGGGNSTRLRSPRPSISGCTHAESLLQLVERGRASSGPA